MNPDGKANLERIFRAGIEAVRPERLIASALLGAIAGTRRVPEAIEVANRVFVAAIGKASIGMAAAIDERLRGKVSAGIAVAPKGENALARTIGRIIVTRGSHPVPDASSEKSAQATLLMLQEATRDDLVIVALSGGASALFALPAGRITIADKISVNDLLLRAGAPIRDFNVVRKHISAVKGGRLVQRCNGATVAGLILSDVGENDTGTIGSGLTSPDSSTYGEASNVLKRFQIWGRTPERIREHLDLGVAGKIEETPKPQDPIFQRVTNAIIADNRSAIEAAARAGSEIGYQVEIAGEMDGDAEKFGIKTARELSAIPKASRRCVIAGGETTVQVRGKGRGGRAQQAALALALELDRLEPKSAIGVLIAGTDGIDGPTDAAGAFVSTDTILRTKALELDATQSLKNNDAYNLFRSINDLFKCGITGTNVADLLIALID
jgi:glycerate 2-kinase